MSEKGKAREWWISEKEQTVVRANPTAIEAFDDEALLINVAFGSDYVIEYSAYAAVVEERDDLKVELKHMEQMYQEELNARR